MAPHQIVDDFLADPGAYRAKALACEFCTIKGPDGEMYKNIAMRPTEEHKELIEAAIGRPISQDYTFLRQSLAGSPLNHAIHADSGYSEFACILYLNTPDQIPPDSGTAFYEHKKLKIQKMPTEQDCRRVLHKSPARVLATLTADWDNRDAWNETGRVDMKFNRAIIYPTKYFHSRLPLDAFGDSAQTSRLIYISFFNA